MSLFTFLFYLLAGLTALCALAVVLSQNIVRAATWLLFTLIGVSGVMFLLGADFVGATELLVYVGGTLVLVAFSVMLTAQGPLVNLKTGAGEWALATVMGLSLFAVLVVSVVSRPLPLEDRSDPNPSGESLTPTITLGTSLLGFPQATAPAHVTGLPKEQRQTLPEQGRRTPMAYLLPFEIVSVHLLVVLVGAAYLARTKRRRTTT